MWKCENKELLILRFCDVEASFGVSYLANHEI